MNVEKREKIIVDWINSYCDKTSFEPKSLVVGISGGIDSSVVSTLCALTNRKTIVLSMPIKQIKSQHDLSIEHGNWLTGRFKNVEHNDAVVFNYPAGDTVSTRFQSNISYYTLVNEYGRDRVWSDKRNFGDIVVRPVDKRENYVKRCIGLPGDTLSIII